jgi:hypothetical protein
MRVMSWLLRISPCIALCLAIGGAAAQPVDSQVRDNIIAALAARGSRPVLVWRFISPTPPIDTKFYFGSRALPDAGVQPYPGPTDVTAAIALLDIGDLRREDQILTGKKIQVALGLGSKPYDRLWFAVYALEAALLKAPNDSADALLEILREFRAVDEPSNLTGAVVHSVRTLQGEQASRRALFVVTDGHNEGVLTLDQVRDVAIGAGVIVNFIILNGGQRPADLPALEAMAVATGGQLIREDDLVSFIGDPFAAIDSGGEQVIPLAGVERFFWETNAKLKAVFSYGDRQFELAVDVDVPRAGVGSTAQHVLANHKIAAGGIGLGVIALGAGATVLLLRRGQSRQPDIASRVDAAVARLEDIGTGAMHSLAADRVTLGRGADNNIVVEDASVSRHHAIIVRDADGIISIESTGKNGTFVNHLEVAMSDLDDGDLITLGKTTFRFIQAA